MGKRLSASEETALLADTIRAAHEKTQELNAAIRDAKTLAHTLVADFERIHRTEIEQLSNHLTSEANRNCAQLNREVETATQIILNHLVTLKPRIDADNGVIYLETDSLLFNDQQPLPYPQHASKEHQS
jgi:hypothetical protein